MRGTMHDQAELFVVEHENGEWIDAQGEGGYSCFLSRTEAQEALDYEAENCEDEKTSYKIVQFSRAAPKEAK